MSAGETDALLDETERGGHGPPGFAFGLLGPLRQGGYVPDGALVPFDLEDGPVPFRDPHPSGRHDRTPFDGLGPGLDDDRLFSPELVFALDFEIVPADVPFVEDRGWAEKDVGETQRPG